MKLEELAGIRTGYCDALGQCCASCVPELVPKFKGRAPVLHDTCALGAASGTTHDLCRRRLPPVAVLPDASHSQSWAYWRVQVVPAAAARAHQQVQEKIWLAMALNIMQRPVFWQHLS